MYRSVGSILTFVPKLTDPLLNLACVVAKSKESIMNFLTENIVMICILFVNLNMIIKIILLFFILKWVLIYKLSVLKNKDDR